MNVVDLTHVITEGMPVYPGTEGPTLTIVNDYAEHGFRETCLTLYSHTGTHMDAPAHLYPTGMPLDQLPITRFMGSAVVIHCSELQAGERITMAHIRRQWAAASQAEYLLFHTGWSRYWGQPEYFEAYPCITHQVADWLLRTGKKGIGLDTISVDPVADDTLALHKKLLATNQMVIVENLTGLEQVGDGLVWFCAMPLKQAWADGAPVRAAAFWVE